MFGFFIFVGVFGFVIFFIIYKFHSVSETLRTTEEAKESNADKDVFIGDSNSLQQDENTNKDECIKRQKQEKYIEHKQKIMKKKKELLKEFRISYVKNITDIVKEYQEILLAKERQHCYKDEYGIEYCDEFIKDLDYFIFNVILRKYDYTQTQEYEILRQWGIDESRYFAFELVLNTDETPTYAGYDGKRVNYNFGISIKDTNEPGDMVITTRIIIITQLDLIKMVAASIGTTNNVENRADTETPLDYEKYIAVKLKELGFNARATKGSGDQGADVLADKNGVKFAIQCKKYSNPVGNKAVQEANTARDYYDCDYAVVVTDSTYTKSARSAANACNVILLHESELAKLLGYTNE